MVRHRRYSRANSNCPRRVVGPVLRLPKAHRRRRRRRLPVRAQRVSASLCRRAFFTYSFFTYSCQPKRSGADSLSIFHGFEQANRWADLASETKTPTALDHVSSSGKGSAPAHTEGAVAFAEVQLDGEEFATITAEKEWEGFSLNVSDRLLNHKERSDLNDGL